MGYNIQKELQGVAMKQNQAIERAKQVKARHEKTLMQLPNVIGVGVGFKEKDGQWTDQIAIVVNVREKMPLAGLSAEDVVPLQLDDIVTDVQEVGEIKAL